MPTLLTELTDEGFSLKKVKDTKTLDSVIEPTYEDEVLNALQNIQMFLEQIDGMLRSRF